LRHHDGVSDVVKDDQAQIEEARQGSEAAFGELVRAHQAAVRAYLGRFSRRADLTDDLAQDVFVTAFRRLETYQGDSPFRLWLFGIARNQWLVHLRSEERRKRRLAQRLELELARGQAAWLETRPQESAHERELAALRHCLKELGGTNAELVREHYFGGVTAVELARRLGRKASAVRMTLLRVRRSLRDCVERKLAAGTA
jgi:RNA polymerase sigma-70 factor (ECF subfamily)